MDKPDQQRDFFVSYTQADRVWAEWLAWELEAAGYTTVLQAWDMPAGTAFVHAMDQAMQHTRHTILVLSPAYVRSAMAEAEWRPAFTADPSGEAAVGAYVDATGSTGPTGRTGRRPRAQGPGDPGSAQGHPLHRARRLEVGQAHHAERVDQPDEAGEDRHQQRDLKGERSRVGVDADDLVLDLLRLALELLLELGVAQQLRVVLERLGDLLLLGRGQHGAVLRHVGEGDGERRQHDGAGERQPERQPERPSGRVHAGGLADPLLRDRGQRVVVELGHQQPQPRSRDQQRHQQPPAGVGAGHDREQQQHPHREQREPQPDDAARAPRSRPSPRQQGNAEHAEREGGDGEPGQQGVVLEHHLQIDRQGDHRAAQGDLLERLLGDPEPEMLGLEQVRVEQRRLSLPLAPREPEDQRRHGDRTDRQEGDDGLAPFLPDQDAQHDAAHPQDGEDRTDQVDLPRAGVGRVADEPDVQKHDRDDDDLEQEPHPPRQVGGDEPAQQRPDRGGDRRRRPHQGVGLALGRTVEVAVDQGLHGRQQQRRADPTHHRPEDDDRGQALGQGHRQGTDGVAEQAQHVGSLAADEVADLAADQDERGRDQRLQRDRRLDAADGGVQVPDHRGDRHVHQRRVDHQHEHRHREQDGQPLTARSLRRSAEALSLGHRVLKSPPRCIRIGCPPTIGTTPRRASSHPGELTTLATAGGRDPPPEESQGLPADADGPVTTTVTRRIKQGHEAAYEEFLAGISGAARTFPGYLGIEIFRPTPGAGDEYRTVYRFDSSAHLRAWLDSPQRAAWLQRAGPHVAGPMRTQVLVGLESWFTLPTRSGVAPPPRYKMAILTWATIFPLITVIVVVSAPLLGSLPVVVRLAATTAVTVSLMTWVVMPRVTRLLHRWLYPDRR